MSKKRKASPAMKALIISVAIFLLLVLIMLILFLKHSFEIRQFNNDIWMLQNQSTICVAEYDGSKIKVTNSNIYAMGTIPPNLTRTTKFNTGTVIDELVCKYTCFDVEWIFHVYQLEGNKLKVTLDGTRNYEFHFKDDGAFEDLLKMTSAEGWNEPNKVLIP